MSRKDIAVIVKETPIHKVEVRTGVMGKRGPKGDIGPKGDRGVAGPEGPMAKDLVVIPTDAAVINITPDNHGDFYITLHNDTPNVAAVMGYTINNENEDISGTASFFTQATDSAINIIGLDENINIIVPLEKLPKPFGIGSTIGVVSRGENTWVVFGDLASAEVIVEDQTELEIMFESTSESLGMLLSLYENGTLVEGVEVDWEWDYLDWIDAPYQGTGTGMSNSFDTENGWNAASGAFGTLTVHYNGRTHIQQINSPPY